MDWKKYLSDVDDDYLVGLSNKGIVKRSYKDLEAGKAAVTSLGETAVVEADGETCTIKIPLGESSCTCPSRTICRHVVQSVLALQKYVAAQGERQASEEREFEEASIDSGNSNGESNEESNKEGNKEGTGNSRRESDGEGSAFPVWEEIKRVSPQAMKKVLGVRKFQSFLNQVLAGLKPVITSTSIVTVLLPGQEMTVKLLSPLEYSSCTCHKKEMCEHKAAAILWCQLERQFITPDALQAQAAQTEVYDREQVRAAANELKNFLEELFDTGLARTSPDVLDYLERLAVICHNAGLPRFESYCRNLLASYNEYLKRMASFSPQTLLGKLSRLYRRACMLLEADSDREIAAFGGEFKSEYHPAGTLELIGIALEYFEGRSGYEGETCYFLEPGLGKWYTYTNARPVFYDSHRKSRLEKAQAPWGLPLAMENLAAVRLRLNGAKVNRSGRLSSSSETKAEVTDEQKLKMSDINCCCYTDFGILFSQVILPGLKGWLYERQDSEVAGLVFIKPHSCEKAVFDRTSQRFSLSVMDENGKEIIIQVTFSRHEAYTIRYLERLAKRLEERPGDIPYFLGRVYLEEGRVRMYPVACLDGKEFLDESL